MNDNNLNASLYYIILTDYHKRYVIYYIIDSLVIFIMEANKISSEADDVLISLIDKETDVPPIPPSIYFAGCAYGACVCKLINNIVILYDYY